MSKRSPDLNQQDAGQASSERPRRANRKPAEAQQYISFLPDGKGSAGVRKGSVPLEVDVEAHIEERTDCEPGLYRIERKRGGEFSGDVFFYPKEENSERGLDLDRFTDEDDGSMPQLEEVSASGTLDAASIAKLVSATVNATLDARERTRRAEQAQPSIVDIMREQREQDRATRAEMREEMRAMMPKPDGGDAFDKFLKMFDRAAEIQERMTPPATSNPNATTFDKILGVASEVARAAPQILPQLAGMAVLQQTSARREPQAAPTMGEVQRVSSPQENVAAPMQQTEGSEAAMTIDVLITNIINDVQHDEAPDACVDDVVRLATEDTKWQPALAQILELPNVEILQTLKDAKGVDLSPLNNAGKFLDGLRKGVKSRIKLQAPPEVHAAASNGNGTAASLKTV